MCTSADGCHYNYSVVTTVSQLLARRIVIVAVRSVQKLVVDVRVEVDELHIVGIGVDYCCPCQAPTPYPPQYTTDGLYTCAWEPGSRGKLGLTLVRNAHAAYCLRKGVGV